MTNIVFGTDGWRDIIGDNFTGDNVCRVADAIGKVFSQDYSSGTLLVSFDTRKSAERYACEAAGVLALHGFTVKVSDVYTPTPTLCWSIAQDDDAIGGIMLTASHNPAEYLGIKIRVADGGASPVEFTQRVEEQLPKTAPTSSGIYERVDIIRPYLDNLSMQVDGKRIADAELAVVVSPLYGAARRYLAEVMRGMGVTVTEIQADEDPSFNGLHPEPIPPWTDAASQTVLQGGYDAGFITDGDADRIGAIGYSGEFINPHRILTLIIQHLVENKGRHGRVIRTLSGSELVARQCANYDLQLTTTPIGFKWIYQQMLTGDVLVGGEESGGIGIPSHVAERDGLLMSLLLLELMAYEKKGLSELVDEMLDRLGRLEYNRKDLRLDPALHQAISLKDIAPQELCGKKVVEAITIDGAKFICEDGSWLLLRMSGTEPLVRVYAEAPTLQEVDSLINAGCSLVLGD